MEPITWLAYAVGSYLLVASRVMILSARTMTQRIVAILVKLCHNSLKIRAIDGLLGKTATYM